MINHGKTRANNKPMPIEVTATKVFVSSNAVPFTETVDGETVSGWEFDFVEYSKDEFILAMNLRNDMFEECIVELAEIIGGEE